MHESVRCYFYATANGRGGILPHRYNSVYEMPIDVGMGFDYLVAQAGDFSLQKLQNKTKKEEED